MSLFYDVAHKRLNENDLLVTQDGDHLTMGIFKDNKIFTGSTFIPLSSASVFAVEKPTLTEQKKRKKLMRDYNSLFKSRCVLKNQVEGQIYTDKNEIRWLYLGKRTLKKEVYDSDKLIKRNETTGFLYLAVPHEYRKYASFIRNDPLLFYPVFKTYKNLKAFVSKPALDYDAVKIENKMVFTYVQDSIQHKFCISNVK